MNVYFIHTRHTIVKSHYIVDGVCESTDERVNQLVFAESRGQAHRLFCAEYELEWLEPVRIVKIATGVLRAKGIARDDDRYWTDVDQLVGEFIE